MVQAFRIGQGFYLRLPVKDIQGKLWDEWPLPDHVYPGPIDVRKKIGWNPACSLFLFCLAAVAAGVLMVIGENRGVLNFCASKLNIIEPGHTGKKYYLGRLERGSLGTL